MSSCIADQDNGGFTTYSGAKVRHSAVPTPGGHFAAVVRLRNTCTHSDRLNRSVRFTPLAVGSSRRADRSVSGPVLALRAADAAQCPGAGGPAVIGEPFPTVLVAAQAGGGWAFEALYRDLAPSVTGYLRLHGALEPDDLASETFLGVFRGLASFRGDEPQFRGWVFTIAHRRLLDEWRRASRRPPAAGGDPDDQLERQQLPGGDVEDDALAAMGSAQVEVMCAALGPDQRAVLLLRILADLTVEQVAQVIGKSVPATKALQRRGLRTLRREIERRGAPL